MVIIGPSGSGKSTLLRCLNRLEESGGIRKLFSRPAEQLFSVRKGKKEGKSEKKPLTNRAEGV